MEWFETAFDTPTWRRIHHAYWEARDAAAIAAHLETIAALPPRAHVLDVPCGIGRLSVALAERGHVVHGVDLNARLVEEAREHAAGHPNVSFAQADMRQLPQSRDFDSVLCWWGSFGYFADEGDEEFVRAARGALRVGGSFLIEGFIAEALLPLYAPSGVMRFGDLLVVDERDYDIETGIIHGTWTAVEGDVATRWSLETRLYGFRELRSMLTRNGFGDVRLLDAATGEAFRMGSRARTLVLARAV